MTRRQRAILLAMQEIEDEGRPISVRGLCRATGSASVGAMHNHITKLVGLGNVGRAGGRYVVVRRVEPIILYRVWDDATKRLVDLR